MVIGASVVKGAKAKSMGLVDDLLHDESSVHPGDDQYIVAQVEKYARVHTWQWGQGAMWPALSPSTNSYMASTALGACPAVHKASKVQHAKCHCCLHAKRVN